MGREVKRVPVGWDWPLNKVWSGYTRTEEEFARFEEDDCPNCERGYTPRANYLHDLWYGKVPFRPEDNGSVPLTAETPAVRAFAERNVTRDERSLSFYVGNQREAYFIQSAIEREAQRLVELWNGMLAHHLNEDDVAALRATDQMPRGLTHRFDPNADPRWQRIEPEPVITAAQLNEDRITAGLFSDNVSVYEFIEARCAAEGVASTCPTCDGHGSLERFPGQREEEEAWERTEPPTGEGWQLWETVSEGSPISPAFATAEELAQWMASPAYTWGAARPMAISTARAFVGIGSSLGTFVQDAGGIHEGADYVGTKAVLDELEGS